MHTILIREGRTHYLANLEKFPRHGEEIFIHCPMLGLGGLQLWKSGQKKWSKAPEGPEYRSYVATRLDYIPFGKVVPLSVVGWNF